MIVFYFKIFNVKAMIQNYCKIYPTKLYLINMIIWFKHLKRKESSEGEGSGKQKNKE
jgi:hypothetical protein